MGTSVTAWKVSFSYLGVRNMRNMHVTREHACCWAPGTQIPALRWKAQPRAYLLMAVVDSTHNFDRHPRARPPPAKHSGGGAAAAGALQGRKQVAACREGRGRDREGLLVVKGVAEGPGGPAHAKRTHAPTTHPSKNHHRASAQQRQQKGKNKKKTRRRQVRSPPTLRKLQEHDALVAAG